MSLTPAPADGQAVPTLCILDPHAESIPQLLAGTDALRQRYPQAHADGLEAGAPSLVGAELDALLGQAQSLRPGAEVVLVEASLLDQPWLLQRLLQLPSGLGLCSGIDAASLDSSRCGDSHLPAPEQLDRLCWLCAPEGVVPAPRIDPRACRLAVEAIAPLRALLAQQQGWDGDLQAGVQGYLLPSLCLPQGAAGLAGLALLQALAARLAGFAAAGEVPGYPGLDPRPVMLHLLHGWGGGSARFVQDLIHADDSHLHLVLQAESDPDRKLAAVALRLCSAPGQPALQRQALSAPIAATAIRSDEYAEILQQLGRRFRVARLHVSSLIGHGLDALRSGLPTALVCHDYHPLWPSLHEDFGREGFDASEPALRAVLEREGRTLPWAELRPEHWLQLRAAYVDAALGSGACLIAPSRSALDTLLRLAPALSALPQRVVPHGLAPWPHPRPSPQPPARPRLRVLVPGRINGGKGEQLLAEVLPRLPDEVEVVLLGCGAAGMRFFGLRGVHVRLDYRHEDFPQAVAELAPDLALLPATVAETFGYLLSELWSLRLPVLATRIGSYAERIQQGRSGLLVDPEPEAVLRALGFLARDRRPLAALRAAQPPLDDLHTMAQAHAEALPDALREHAVAERASAAERALQAAEATLAARAAALATAAQQRAQQERELAERAQWALDQEKLAAERTAWAQSLRAETEALHRALATQEAETEAQRARLQRMLQRLAGDLREEGEPVDEGAIDLDGLLGITKARLRTLAGETLRQRQHIASLEQQRDHFEDERNRILQSASWRLTRPLRGARRLLGSALARLSFRRQRVGSLLQRGLRSLRTRGLRGTLARLRAEARPPITPSALSVPESAPFAPFELPCPEAPRVSVVIPVYNHLQHSLTCLRSIAAQPSRISAEILVVDDCSSDETASVLPQIGGLRYLRNAENLGFIGACNAGAAAARGDYLVFLNNDTAVQPGWLDALIDTFEQHPEAGLVGAKLVYPDGRLQEAGGIVFADGSGWNYGRFGDPAAPEHNYLREVDYCSGAAIALPAELFREFGGFDPHYAPAYYEDTDLAMKVRQRGLKVLYQPKSTVVHFEGVSSGTDTSTGTKAYQVVNQGKFLERWREVLASHPAPGTPIERARQHRDRRHVLIIDATTPAPDQDSGSLRMVNLMRVLRSEGCAVTFFADNRAFVERYSEDLQQLGVEVLWHPWLADVPGWFAQHGERFDLVILSRHYIAVQYVDLVRAHAPQAVLAFDTVDLHYLREQREAELTGREDLRRHAEQTRERELDLIRRCDVTLVVSPVEQALLASEAPGARVEILSNVHEVHGRRKGFAERHDLVFMGGYQHPPNVDAVAWFADAVLPLIHAEAPELVFHIVGSKAPDEVRALGERPGVMFHGFVPDVAPFMDDCRLAVAPLRYGAGVKGKVNMSMSYGQPVVATPIAIEGMHAEPGRDVLVAESPEDFARAVLAAYRDPALWLQLSEGGLANVEAHFGFESARRAVRGLLKG